MNSTLADERRHFDVNITGKFCNNKNTWQHVDMFVPANGISSSQDSGLSCRRDSSGTVPKCDNVTKYPDKKQIEDKLTQIREYIRVTSSLMATTKHDEQV